MEEGRQTTYSLLTTSAFGNEKRGSASQSRVVSVPSAVALVIIWTKRKEKFYIMLSKIRKNCYKSKQNKYCYMHYNIQSVKPIQQMSRKANKAAVATHKFRQI